MSEDWLEFEVDFEHFMQAFSLLARLSRVCSNCVALTSRYTCPFVEKFSIDIETYYKTDPGEHVNVFNLSPAEKRQTILGEEPFSFPLFCFVLCKGFFLVCPTSLSCPIHPQTWKCTPVRGLTAGQGYIE